MTNYERYFGTPEAAAKTTGIVCACGDTCGGEGAEMGLCPFVNTPCPNTSIENFENWLCQEEE